MWQDRALYISTIGASAQVSPGTVIFGAVSYVRLPRRLLAWVATALAPTSERGNTAFSNQIITIVCIFYIFCAKNIKLGENSCIFCIENYKKYARIQVVRWFV